MSGLNHLVCVVLGWLVGGDDVGRSLEDLTRSLRPGQPVAERLAAVQELAAQEGVKVTESLLGALEKTCDELRSVERDFERVSASSVRERAELGLAAAGHDQVAEAIAAGLVSRTDEPSFDAMLKGLKRARYWRLQCYLLEILGNSGREGAREPLERAALDRDPRVRARALAGIGQRKDLASLHFVHQALQDDEWQVRAVALEAVENFAERQSVPHLVAAMARERGRLRPEMASLLTLLTGQQLGVEAGPWVRWWEEVRDEFLAAVESDKVKVGKPRDYSPFSYYGVQTWSDKVIFILDASDSMNQGSEETDIPGQENVGAGESKIAVARRKLQQAIRDLDSDTTFNIIVYNKYIRAWQPGMMKAVQKNKDDAVRFVDQIVASEATNVFDALELAFLFAGQTSTEKYARSAVDTIFFLTDGDPSDGRITEFDAILREVRRLNRDLRIQIHTIGVGYLHRKPFLEALARENGGHYVNVQ